jgi:Brp/Blh family beta-carotene 15,15'-monooxygenase
MPATARSLHRVIYLLIAALAIALSLIETDITEATQLGLLAVCVALLGVPHASLDPLVAYASGLAQTPVQLTRFLLTYITQAALVVVLWWIAPAIALSGFLMFSALHFQGDWRQDLYRWQSLSVAVAVICMPAVFHPAAVREIFSQLLFGATATPLLLALQLVGTVSLTLLCFTAIRVGRARPRVALELISLPLLAWALPPLLYFVVYFCGLHSPRHVIDLLRTIRVRHHVILTIVSFVTALTIAVAIGAYLWLPVADTTQRLLAIVFVGLAALTVPHMLLIERAKSRLDLSEANE